MSDLIAIVEGNIIPRGEAVSRIRKAAKDHGFDAKQAINKWEAEGGNYEKNVDVKSVNSFLKRVVGKKAKVSGGKSKGSSAIYDLADAVKREGLGDQVLSAIENMGIGGGKDKLGRGLKGAGKFAKKLAFGEGVITEEEVTDDLVRDYFDALVQKYGNPTTNEGISESIVDDFLDTKLDINKLKSIISVIDKNNEAGIFSSVKDSILSKWQNSKMDTSTLRGISNELMSLSKKGIDF